MSRIRKFFRIVISMIVIYILSFGPIWGWYTARNQPAPASVLGFYTPIRAAFRVPGLSFPLVVYLYIWERVYGGH